MRTYRVGVCGTTSVVLALLVFAFSVSSFAKDEDLAIGLAGYWPCDVSSDLVRVRDQTGFHNDFTLSASGASFVNTGGFSAISFDGVSGMATATDSVSLHMTTAMTLLLWVKLERVQMEAYEFVIKSGSFILYCYVAGEKPKILGEVTMSGTMHYAKAASVLPGYGEWHQVGFVFGDYDNSGVQRIANIVDGKVIADNVVSEAGSIGVTNRPLVLNSRKLHKGLVDEIRLYNRALTSPDVARLYELGRKGK